jgi:hypothetical protein
MDYQTLRTWENANGQIMTARWLNGVLNNLDYCQQAAVYGASPFRAVKCKAVVDKAVWLTAFWGEYYHVNAALTCVYDLMVCATAIETSPPPE